MRQLNQWLYQVLDHPCWNIRFQHNLVIFSVSDHFTYRPQTGFRVRKERVREVPDKRAVIEQHGATRYKGRIWQKFKRSPISSDNSLMRHVMPAAAHPIFNPADVGFRIGGAHKIYGHVVSRIIGAGHEIHFTPMRHHSLEAEIQPACETAVALDIRNRLRLLGTHRFRQIERGRDLVWIDIFAEIDSRSIR
jgi:hypothetical protein